MEDEGQALRSRLSGAGFKPPQAASVKSRCRERWGKGRRYRSGVGHGDERERTPDDVSKGSLATSKPGAGLSLLGQGWGGPDDGPTGVRHEGGVTVILASMRNVRTCRSDVTGAGQAGGPCKSTKAEHRGGVARSSEEGSVMGLERRGGLVQWESDGQPVIERNCRDLTTGSMVCLGREEPYETRVCAVKNGGSNPCRRQEKLGEMLLGQPSYRHRQLPVPRPEGRSEPDLPGPGARVPASLSPACSAQGLSQGPLLRPVASLPAQPGDPRASCPAARPPHRTAAPSRTTGCPRSSALARGGFGNTIARASVPLVPNRPPRRHRPMDPDAPKGSIAPGVASIPPETGLGASTTGRRRGAT